MDKLYVFAIGGSGERVVKSLVMMLTAGVKIGAQQVIPVFIDNDVKSNAFTTCCDLIKYYNATPSDDHAMGANSLYLQENNDSTAWGSFFQTPISKPIVLNKAGNAIGNLNTVINFRRKDTKYHKAIEDEINLLFTQNDLAMPLNVGFVGNPNIGSVVLNSLSLESEDFTNILNNVTNRDGVIVVGSLFGGTGAAGLPLVINKFKDRFGTTPNNKPVLGGVAVLPYFSTQKSEEPQAGLDLTKWNVDSDAFTTKTRAALMYYDEYMKLGYDYLYYVGDSESMDVFPHKIGAEEQKNPYHIVDLMSALSIIDFSKQSSQKSIVYKSPIWGFNTDIDSNTSNISGIYNSDLAHALAKFQIMCEMFKSEEESMLHWAIDTRKTYVENIGFNEIFRKSVLGDNKTYTEAWGLSELIKEFDRWMKELSATEIRRPFLLFDATRTSTGDNVTTNFYSANEFGIAQSVEQGWLWNRHIEAKEADIASEMQSAYNSLYPKIKKGDVAQSKTLAMLLKVISVALDNVLSKNCIKL